MKRHQKKLKITDKQCEEIYIHFLEFLKSNKKNINDPRIRKTSKKHLFTSICGLIENINSYKRGTKITKEYFYNEFNITSAWFKLLKEFFLLNYFEENCKHYNSTFFKLKEDTLLNRKTDKKVNTVKKGVMSVTEKPVKEEIIYNTDTLEEFEKKVPLINTEEELIKLKRSISSSDEDYVLKQQIISSRIQILISRKKQEVKTKDVEIPKINPVTGHEVYDSKELELFKNELNKTISSIKYNKEKLSMLQNYFNTLLYDYTDLGTKKIEYLNIMGKKIKEEYEQELTIRK